MDTKKCIHCNEVKSIDNFCKDKHRSDGHHPYCRNCRTEFSRIRMKNNPTAQEKARINTRKYRLTEQGKEKGKIYYQEHKQIYRQREREYSKRDYVKKHNAEKSKQYRKNNIDKTMARYTIKRLVRAGKVSVPKNCEWCGEPFIDGEPIHAHHWKGYDFEHWLDVKFVHAKCHREMHRAMEWKSFVPLPDLSDFA
jgi:hypothetical protein